MIQFYLSCISVTWLFTQHRDAKMFHNWLFYKAYEKRTNHDLKEYWAVKNSWAWGIHSLITCPYCVGFWLAFGVGTLALPVHNIFDLAPILATALICALFSMLTVTIYEKLTK